MSFNKRYVSIETIKAYYKSNGLESFRVLFSEKIDAFIFMDELSSKIYKMYQNGDHKKINQLLHQQ